MKENFETFSQKTESSEFDHQYDHPEVLQCEKDELTIYDVKPENPDQIPIVFAPGWLPNPEINKDIIKTFFNEGKRTLSFYAPHGIEVEAWN